MHPQIIRNAPGNCPICGMALEPRSGSPEKEENVELLNMKRRFWVSLVLTVPLIFITMSIYVPAISVENFLTSKIAGWLELILASPVVLWGDGRFSSGGQPP